MPTTLRIDRSLVRITHHRLNWTTLFRTGIRTDTVDT